MRNELTPESDIDILLEFQPGIDPDLFELGGMQQELSDIFDREVDLKTPDMFSPHNLKRILASSVLGYAGLNADHALRWLSSAFAGWKQFFFGGLRVTANAVQSIAESKVVVARWM